MDSISYYIKVSVLFKQLKSLLFTFRLIFIVVLIMLGILLGLHFFNDVPIEVLTNDLAVLGKLPIYAGVLSQIGIFLWSATGAICLYSLQFISNKKHKTFIKASAFITIFLGLDDAFMFHEILFPSLGILQKIVFLCYGILMSFYFLRYYKLIFKTDFILLGLAMISFGSSLFIDNLMANTTPYVSKLLEDGFKFLGILFWLGYFVKTTKQLIGLETLEAS